MGQVQHSPEGISAMVPSACPICASTAHRLVWRFPFLKLSTCNVCGLTFGWDRAEPDASQLQDDWETDADNIDSYYEQQFEIKSRAYLAALKDAGATGGKLLDVGAAYGAFLNAAQRSGWQVAGIEPSPFACQEASKRFGLKLRRGFFNEHSYPAGEFSVVCSFDVLEHIETPRTFLAAARTVLRQDGHLILSVPNYSAPTNWLSLLSYPMTFGKVDIAAKLMTQVAYRSHHVLYFTKATICELLSRVGFEPVSVQTVSTLFPRELLGRKNFATWPRWTRSAVANGMLGLQALEGLARSRDTLLVVARKVA